MSNAAIAAAPAGVNWRAGFLLGAMMAPTDAAAVAEEEAPEDPRGRAEGRRGGDREQSGLALR